MGMYVGKTPLLGTFNMTREAFGWWLIMIHWHLIPQEEKFDVSSSLCFQFGSGDGCAQMRAVSSRMGDFVLMTVPAKSKCNHRDFCGQNDITRHPNIAVKHISVTDFKQKYRSNSDVTILI